MKKAINIIVIAVATLFVIQFTSCSQWKSYDGHSESELMKIAYDEGYDWGHTFGVKIHFDNGYGESGYDRLKKAFKKQYFGENLNNEDERVFLRCRDELFRGVQEGIRANPNGE